MKFSRLFTMKRIIKAVNLIGVVFLLAGLMLSLVSQPVAAGVSSSKATPIVPPGGSTPEPGQTPVPHLTYIPGPDSPGRLNPKGKGSQGGDADSVQPFAPPVPVRVQDEYIGTVRFTQQNYCLSTPEGTWVTATAVVSLPPGVTANLSTDWYVVWPRPYAPNPGYNEHHYENVPVENGSRISWDAWWPGANAFDPTATPAMVEIHWGAQILSAATGNDISPAAGLDAFFNGSCNARPELSLGHTCSADGSGIDWTVNNPSGESRSFTYTVDGGAPQSSSVAAGASYVFTQTTGGVHDVSITFDDGLGNNITRTDSSVAGECLPIPSLSVTNACTDAGVTFYATNPPDGRLVTISYNADNGAQIGEDIEVAPGATVEVVTLTDRSVDHSVVIEWPDGLGRTGRATSDYTGGTCTNPARLVLAHQCIDGSSGGIRWLAYNPGAGTVSYTYTFDGNAGDAGGDVPPGQTVTVLESTGGLHDLVVIWEGGSTSDSSTIEECGGSQNGPLAISFACIVPGGGIQWSVTNNGTTAKTFNWEIDSGAQDGSNVTIGAGETISNIATTSGGSHLMTVTWRGGSTFAESKPEDCGQPPVLTIETDCKEVGGGIEWYVVNRTASDIRFDWDLDNGRDSGEDALAPAGERTFVADSLGGVHTLSVGWTGGSTSFTSSPESCGGSVPLELGLSYDCAETAGSVDWFVDNRANDADVTFEWSMGNQSGLYTVSANSRERFLTTDDLGRTVRIEWQTGIGSEDFVEVTAEAGKCTEEEQARLVVTYTCTRDNRIAWTARNRSSIDADFLWTLDDGAQSGSDSVGANASKRFLTTGNGRHTVRISWPGEDPTRSYSSTSPRDACLPPGETPPPPPPPPPSVTPTPRIELGTLTPGVPPTGPNAGATLGAPGTGGAGGAANSGDNVLIGNTGGDLTAQPLSGAALMQRLFTNLGLLFLGVGLVLQGVWRMR